MDLLFLAKEFVVAAPIDPPPNTDSRGKVISREFTTGNTTTIYDASGRNVGRVTTNPQR